jgi:hypothetical protein
MTDHDDPVDAVILAFLDHREGTGPRPTLDHLAPADRRRATEILTGLANARGIDPREERPSVAALLADTPLAGLLAAAADEMDRLLAVLSDVDDRAQVEAVEGTAVHSFLDLRSRFVPVPAAVPTVTPAVRAMVRALFAGDPDCSRVGVVAMHADDLATQLLAPEDLADTITTPRGEPHRRWEPPLPLALAARRVLELRAPEWPAFDFDAAGADPLDLPALVTGIAGRVIARESARSYKGEKRRAYQALVGREAAFAELVAAVQARGSDVDIAAETARILRAAA